jgi:hypothetical protein
MKFHRFTQVVQARSNFDLAKERRITFSDANLPAITMQPDFNHFHSSVILSWLKKRGEFFL